VYQREGWVGYPDWLGYAETAPPPEQVGKQLEDEAEAWTALSCHHVLTMRCLLYFQIWLKHFR